MVGAVVAIYTPVLAFEAIGAAHIIDGDTIVIAGESHRLHGIDAPEMGQICFTRGGAPWPCGERATAALEALIGDAPVRCVSDKRGVYGRHISICTVGGVDLGAWMVVHGWALAYRAYSTAYIDEEAAARTARAGLWSGSFTKPWEWRRQN